MEIDEALDRVAGTPDAELRIMAENDFVLPRALATLVLHGRERNVFGDVLTVYRSHVMVVTEGEKSAVALLRALAGEPETDER